MPSIPDTGKGFRRLLDPYVSCYRADHRPFTAEEQYQSKDQITFYSEFDTPRVSNFIAVNIRITYNFWGVREERPRYESLLVPPLRFTHPGQQSE